MKLCDLPKFHPQYSFELSVSYISVPILGSCKCNLVVYKCKLIFGISLLFKRNKMMSAFISFRRLFLFFQQTDSLKSFIMQPQSYLKSQKMEIKFVLEILCYL